MKAFFGAAVAAAAMSTSTSVGAADVKNFLLIAVDDLRPLFGRSYGVEEVLAPNMDKHFLDSKGTVMTNSYVQIAVCGPSRSSILTSRRPDSTHVGVQGGTMVNDWCWCQRSDCKEDELFMTLPTYLARHGFVTSGTGKIYHPDACTNMHQPHSYGHKFAHAVGDDFRAWNHGTYGVEGRLEKPERNVIERYSEEQFGSIPGPFFTEFKGTTGDSWLPVQNITDEQEVDGLLATDAISRLQDFSQNSIGGASADEKPFFLAVGFHKPHLPHNVPAKYFDLYDRDNISLPPSRFPPVGFLEENWHADGTAEMATYNNNVQALDQKDGTFGFEKPLNESKTRELRHGYFAATTFIDAQIGRVMDALEASGFANNTAVAVWSDHGWHLGDANAWCKMTNYETATRNTLLWRIPGQSPQSQGQNSRLTEMVDFFPTVTDLLGVPPLDKCEGVDQPPTVECVQGESYADEFFPTERSSTPKTHAFSQWAFPVWQSPNASVFRMGYTVRSADGYRLTKYVPYDDNVTFKGNWSVDLGPGELYDYNTDRWESTNHVNDPKYAQKVAELETVLRQQYVPSAH